jgi:hypothetical protein
MLAGCEPDEIIAGLGLEWKDLFARRNGRPADGLTLQAYADAKSLPVSFLRRLGLTQIYLSGMPVIRIPYMDLFGVEISTRMRLALSGGNEFRWKTGSKAFLYGLWRLPRTRPYIVLVEGESDCHTLWFKGFPALGLPGANKWEDSWAPHFDGFERIYVVIEPDKGGEAVLKWLGASRIRCRVRLITLPGAKDPSELYLSDQDGFTAAWKAAMKAAVPWSQREKAENRAKKEAAWAQCRTLAQKEDILQEFAQALAASGVAGEQRALQTLYLALISRFLTKLVSLVFTGPSSAGKSYLVAQTLAFLPSSAYRDFTAMSEKALAYFEEPLSHRFLVLYEGAALSSEMQNYMVRSLLSEGRLKYITVEKTPNGLRPREIVIEGPTGLIMTTTAVTLHPENATRHFEVVLSDSPEQTRLILRATAARHSGKQDQNTAQQMAEWHALQEWLSYANHRVIIRWAPALSELIPPSAVRLRRDFEAFLNLVEAHAILHQKNRRCDDQGRIVAMLKDYSAVRNLLNPALSQGVERTVSETTQQTVKAVAEICAEKEENEQKRTNKGLPVSRIPLRSKRLRISCESIDPR